MTFSRYMRFFQSYGDEMLFFMGVKPETLNEWKSFRQSYTAERQKLSYIWIVPQEEMIEAWWRAHPEERGN